MFFDEASLASQVRHPHVIEIMDLGEQDRILYLVMEWVSGEALSIIMKYCRHARRHHPLPIAVHIATQTCRGLHAAHELREADGVLVGLVHRDVSPQNVLVTYDGDCRQKSWTLAAKATAPRLDTYTGNRGRAAQRQDRLHVARAAASGEKIDRRTDVFAMGILLYMMTTGKASVPRRRSRAQTIARISSDEPAILPSVLVPGYPAGLEACVMQALAKDSAKRYPSANDMLIGLTRALPSAMRESTDEEVSEFIRRLLPDRLERQKQAIKQALEQADRREMSRSTPQLHMHDSATDEPATVLEGIGREMTPSADGRSLPGASSTEPPPSFARAESARRRNLLVVAFGVILLLGAGLGFAFGHDDRPRAAAVAPLPAPTPQVETPPTPTTVVAPTPLPALEARCRRKKCRPRVRARRPRLAPARDARRPRHRRPSRPAPPAKVRSCRRFATPASNRVCFVLVRLVVMRDPLVLSRDLALGLAEQFTWTS